ATEAESREKALLKAADLVYREVASRGRLSQIPSFPHTEAHSHDSLFSDTIVEGGSQTSQIRAYEALGAAMDDPSDTTDLGESRDAFQALEDALNRASKIKERYERMVASTKLRGFELPAGDFAAFQRSRAGLAGPIRSIRNQLMQVKTVLDEEPGKQSGQVEMQMAMQVVASGQQRTDVFVREEPIVKDEAWVILVDASKSLNSAAFEVRGIATCLAEVAKDLMTERSRWALLAFNDRLQVLKDFEESYTIDHRARIGGLRQEGPTFLPDALEVAAKSLALRPVEAKYLVVVSDFLPTGYEGIEDELKRVVSGLGKKGVMMVGLGVQSSAVKEYFRVSSVLTTPYEMMRSFVKAYLELSAAA
ncbi:MAG: VWA domain-containing protein, partial [Nitrososphaerota archaeon]|nr:VWA domain-containing protein [Nitrososphaerota archaeon]